MTTYDIEVLALLMAIGCAAVVYARWLTARLDRKTDSKHPAE